MNRVSSGFHQTTQNEFYASASDTNCIPPHSLDELQADVDAWMQTYYAERTQ